MSETLTSLPPLDDTFGAFFLGCILSVLFYGVSVVQYLYYYTRKCTHMGRSTPRVDFSTIDYQKDKKFLRLFVRDIVHKTVWCRSQWTISMLSRLP